MLMNHCPRGDAECRTQFVDVRKGLGKCQEGGHCVCVAVGGEMAFTALGKKLRW